MEAMPRSGTVRASSHLPPPAPEHSGSDWLARLRQQAEQQHSRPDSATHQEHAWHAEGGHEPDAEPDHHDDDDVHNSAHDEATEHEEAPGHAEHSEHGEVEEASPWYRSNDTAAGDHPPGSAAHDSVASTSRPTYVTPRRTVAGASDDSAIIRRAGMPPGHRLIEKSSTPKAFSRQQQQVRGTNWPSSQQSPHGTRQALATQQRVNGAKPPTQTPGRKLAAQPQAPAQAQRPAANPAQNAPTAPQSPAAVPPRHKSYFVFPRGANVVILYNKKAVGNSLLQHSSGTTLEQQALRMLQDYSGAATNPRLIDISDPGWARKLDALAAQNKGGFAHLVVLDHGYSGNQRFGRFPGSYNNETSLTPQSTAWKIISSVMAPEGHIHLGGCRVGEDQEGQKYLNELLKSLGKGAQISIDAVTGPMYNRSNFFEGDLIRAQPLP